MKNKTNKVIKQQMIDAYKSAMSPIYRQWSQDYSSDELKLIYLKLITQHITNKITASLKRKNKPNGKLNKLIELLEEKQYPKNDKEIFEGVL